MCCWRILRPWGQTSWDSWEEEETVSPFPVLAPSSLGSFWQICVCVEPFSTAMLYSEMHIEHL